MPDLVIDQLWECPVCGSQFGMGEPAKMSPLTCRMGHAPTEMEQKAVEAWRTDWDEEA